MVSVGLIWRWQGLLDLAEIAGLLNKTEEASQWASEAAALKQTMESLMWNASAGTSPHLMSPDLLA
eukprot:COSAG06_NODE_6438_length_2933_cov_2.436133_3_plen_66_part_00